MGSFKDFMRWYNNKDVVPTLEAIQKMIAFYHDKNIDVLKLGCNLPNLANICLHKSTDKNSIHSRKGIKAFRKKFEKMLLVVHLSFSHGRQLLMKLLFESLQTFANLLLGLMPANYIPIRCVNPRLPAFMRVGIWIQKRVDSHLDKTRNKTRSFENMVMSYFQRTRPDCKIESFYTTGRQKKIDCFIVDGFCSHCNTVFEAMGCFYHFCPCQKLLPSLTEEDIKRGSRRRELDELRRGYIQETGFTVIEIWECEWWRLYKTTTKVKIHIRENFPYRRSLTEQQLLEGIKKGNLFGYVQCDIEVPENLKENFANFPPVFKNILVSKNDIADLMKTYAEEEGIMSQPRKKTPR